MRGSGECSVRHPLRVRAAGGRFAIAGIGRGHADSEAGHAISAVGGESDGLELSFEPGAGSDGHILDDGMPARGGRILRGWGR